MPDMKQQNVAECLNTLFNANLVEDIMKNGKKGKWASKRMEMDLGMI